MPLPDERPRQSVANLIGRFEQQTKKQRSSSPGPRSSSVVSHTTGDSAKEEAKEKREWPPRTSTVASPPNDTKAGGREWQPRLSTQSSGDSPGPRWPPIQPTVQASPFSELKKSPTSPSPKSSELATPPEVTKSPSPPAETPKVIEVTPPSRKPTRVEPEPPKPVKPEPVETPKTPPKPTVDPPSTKSGPSSVATKSPPKTVKTTPTKSNTKSNTKTPSKPPPSSFTKGTPLHADASDRRTSTSARPPSRSASHTNLRSKTPTSTPVRPSSATQRKPPTETPKHTPTSVKRPKTPTAYHPPATPNKPPPVIPKTPNSRLYAPTAASLAKSTNSPQLPPPERKKTLSSGASLERLSKPTASSLSKSKSAHSITTSPPKSKPNPTKTGTLTAAKKTVEAAGSTSVNSAKKDGGVYEEHHGNDGAGLLVTGEALGPECVLSDAENHEHESDREHEHLGNGSLEVSYIEEPLETTDEASARDHEEAPHSPVHQEHVEEPEELSRSHSPESVDPASDLYAEEDAVLELSCEVSVEGADDEGLNQERAKVDIADIVGLLESTSFTSTHIFQGPGEGVANGLQTPGSDKRIGEIPDED